MKGDDWMLRIAVCDDQPEYLQDVAEKIHRWSRERELPTEIFRYDNGDDLISANASLPFDLIFLDIIMPLLNGMETAKEIRQQNKAVQIIFLTSSPEFALEAFSVKAQGYLLKPVSYELLKDALEDCTQTLEVEPKHLLLKTAFGYQKIYYHNIEYAEAQNKKVLFHLSSGDTAEVLEPLYSFEDKLTDRDGFFKCHRSYLVYLPNVDRFNSTELITKSGRTVPIARGFAKPFKEAYFSLMFQE
ncbi:MAG: response regulator transcription factor [Oscillospiraceae bacterium]|nr:response regulator transcription factor [Oscillospiraceae bacterium]